MSAKSGSAAGSETNGAEGIIVSSEGELRLVRDADGAAQVVQSNSEAVALSTGDVIASAQGATIIVEVGQPITLSIPPGLAAKVILGDESVALVSLPVDTLAYDDEAQWVADLQQQLSRGELSLDDLAPTAAGNAADNGQAEGNVDSDGGLGQPALLIDTDETGLLGDSAGLPTAGFTLSANAVAQSANLSLSEQSSAPELLNTGATLTAPSSALFAAVTEDFQVTARGQLDGSATPISTRTDFGQIELSADGQWTYQLNNALSEVQALGAGDVLREQLALGEHTLYLTIHGSNDQAQVSGDSIARLKDVGDDGLDAIVLASGKLSISDVDTGEARFEVVRGKATRFGELDVDSDGAWQYTLNTALDAVTGLPEGKTAYEFIAVRTVDGSIHTLTVGIEGSNQRAQVVREPGEFDDPALANGVLIDLAETTLASGKLNVLDPDFAESKFQADALIEGKLGVARIDEAGNWQFELNTELDVLNDLGDGEILRDFVRVHTVDGTAYDLIVSVQGSAESVLADTVMDSRAGDDGEALFGLTADSLVLAAAGSDDRHDGQDLYVWQPGHADAVTLIEGFHTGTGGDTLVLDQVLLAEGEALEGLLQFSFEGDNTVLTLASAGGSEQLVFAHTDLRHLGANDGEIIQALIDQGNLDVAAVS